jgi:di/tricarboxylate transporter
MASIFIPIADKLAKDVGVNPIYYMLPMTVSVSLAFMLPFATSTNTVCYGCGRITVYDMVISLI